MTNTQPTTVVQTFEHAGTSYDVIEFHTPRATYWLVWPTGDWQVSPDGTYIIGRVPELAMSSVSPEGAARAARRHLTNKDQADALAPAIEANICTVSDPESLPMISDPQVGDVVVCSGTGRWRTGVVSKVTRKTVTVLYLTPSRPTGKPFRSTVRSCCVPLVKRAGQ